MRAKITAVVLTLVLGLAVLAGCGSSAPAAPENHQGRYAEGVSAKCLECHGTESKDIPKVHFDGDQISKNYENCASCHANV